MSEKFYVVSEVELVHLRSAAWHLGFSVGADIGDLDEAQEYKVEAEGACRTRPVQPIGTETDELGTSQLWREDVKR